jgi:ribosomal protein L23
MKFMPLGFIQKFKNKIEQSIAVGRSRLVPPTKEKGVDDTKMPATLQAATGEQSSFRAMESALFLAPVTTEKSAALAGNHQYVFRVHPLSTRTEIGQAFFRLYGVRPLRVNIIKCRADRVRFAGRRGKQRAFKKAIVRVSKYAKVEIYAS